MRWRSGSILVQIDSAKGISISLFSGVLTSSNGVPAVSCQAQRSAMEA